MQNKIKIELNTLSGSVNPVIIADIDVRFTLKTFSGRLDYKDFEMIVKVIIPCKPFGRKYAKAFRLVGAVHLLAYAAKAK